MITPDYVQMMARYNRWQNQALLSAASTLSPDDRITDRGAFFGSIHATLSHLLWGDTIWMSRFDGGAAPSGGIADSSEFAPDWAGLKVARGAMDDRIIAWAKSFQPIPPETLLAWHSGALGRAVEKPLALCITHFFNHQTHHRGQVHAMLTAAGARPGDTDLFIMPEAA
ncbi:MAG: DinB family protein [Pseudomonadota bacterium]